MVEGYRELARYNRWMNQRVYAVCAELSDAERRLDRGAFFGSIHATLTHLLITDRIWLARLVDDSEEARFSDERGEPIALEGLATDVLPDFSRLRAEREKTDERLVDFADALQPEQAAGAFRYRNVAGKRFEHPLWWALTHLFNHQTHHRGQVTTLLSQLGRDVGVTDFVIYLREQAG